MYAIIKTGGKQYRAEEGTELLVERLPGEVGDKVQFQPLLVRDETQIHIAGKAKVEAVIVDQSRGPKVQSFKYNPKKGYKRMIGHRQELTKVRIEKIALPGAARPKQEEAEAEQADKPEKAVRAEKAVKPENAVKAREPVKAEKTERAEKPEKAERTAKAVKSEKVEKAEKAAKVKSEVTKSGA